MPRPPKPDKRRSNGDGGLWQLPNGRWRWEIVLGYVTTPEGNLSRKTKSGTAADKTAAKKDLTLARAAHLNNDLPPPNRITVSEWLENWIATRTKIRPNTLTNYKGYIKHIVPVIGSKRLQSLKPLDLENMYRILVGKEVSFRNLQGVHGVLYSAFSSAVKLEIVNRNVADIVRPEISFNDKPSRASTAWTAKEAETFLKVAREDKLYVVFYLLLSLGLRRGEVCGLRWEHVDLKNRVIRIEEALINEGGKPTVSQPKTKNSRRALRIPSDVAEVLRVHKENQAQRHEDNNIVPSRDWLFTDDKGAFIYPERVNDALERLCTVAGVRKVRVHDLRHTYASLARRAGVPLEIVSEKLGHHKPSFTADIYRHTFQDEHDIATLNLSTLLANQPKAQA